MIGPMIGAGAEAHTLFEICAVPGLFAAAAIWVVAGHKRRGEAAAPAAAPVRTAEA